MEGGVQAVKKGQQIAKLDDAIQQATVALAKHSAETTVLVRYAQNQLDSAKKQWEKVKNNQGFSPEEKRQTELDVKQSRAGGWRRRRRSRRRTRLNCSRSRIGWIT